MGIQKVIRGIYVALICFATTFNVAAHQVTPHAKFSLLTCTPGPDLYSLFGHSAIRFQDSIGGRWIDVVYNYGTFVFDDDFYYKFARGKLDYVLSLETFANFQYEYIQTGRGVYEQILNLDQAQSQKLFQLLEENTQPENRTYRYDFFYDNCSSRIRDMIIRATAEGEKDQLGYYAPDTSAIRRMNRIGFTYVYPGKITYRQAIQKYLNFQPWSDFGIDLALGLPCDKEVGKMGFMFLPDSLMKDFHFAILGEQALTGPDVELLPQEYEPSVDSIFTPLTVMMLVLVVHVLISWYFWKKGKSVVITDRIIFFSIGLLGLLVVFLWFFTDHQATKMNFNLLWANPVFLIMAFMPGRLLRDKYRRIMSVLFFILAATICLWFVLPQKMHLAAIPLCLALIFSMIKILRPALYTGNNSHAKQQK
jgi:hypothetical protein